MPDSSLYIQKLVEANPIREPVLRSAIQALELPSRSQGLDAGCGIGLQTLLLADAVGSEGHITGVDLLSDLLAYGQTLTDQMGYSGRVTFKEGNVGQLPFAAGAFDWVWSADCIGYPVGDLLPALAELGRVVKPGGRVVLLAWSSQQVLPGHPLLEARLNATCTSYLPFLNGAKPEHHFLRALHAFQAAGFVQIKAQTFVGQVQTPLCLDERVAMISLFDMLWGQQVCGVLEEDWCEFQRLCKPESRDFILDEPGYYAFFTYTMFQGSLPCGECVPLPPVSI